MFILLLLIQNVQSQTATGQCSEAPVLCCTGLNSGCERTRCYCDEYCQVFKDCCSDYTATCTQAKSTSPSKTSPYVSLIITKSSQPSAVPSEVISSSTQLTTPPATAFGDASTSTKPASAFAKQTEIVSSSKNSIAVTSLESFFSSTKSTVPTFLPLEAKFTSTNSGLLHSTQPDSVPTNINPSLSPPGFSKSVSSPSQPISSSKHAPLLSSTSNAHSDLTSVESTPFSSSTTGSESSVFTKPATTFFTFSKILPTSTEPPQLTPTYSESVAMSDSPAWPLGTNVDSVLTSAPFSVFTSKKLDAVHLSSNTQPELLNEASSKSTDSNLVPTASHSSLVFTHTKSPNLSNSVPNSIKVAMTHSTSTDFAFITTCTSPLSLKSPHPLLTTTNKHSSVLSSEPTMSTTDPPTISTIFQSPLMTMANGLSITPQDSTLAAINTQLNMQSISQESVTMNVSLSKASLDNVLTKTDKNFQIMFTPKYALTTAIQQLLTISSSDPTVPSTNLQLQSTNSKDQRLTTKNSSVLSITLPVPKLITSNPHMTKTSPFPALLSITPPGSTLSTKIQQSPQMPTDLAFSSTSQLFQSRTSSVPIMTATSHSSPLFITQQDSVPTKLNHSPQSTTLTDVLLTITHPQPTITSEFNLLATKNPSLISVSHSESVTTKSNPYLELLTTLNSALTTTKPPIPSVDPALMSGSMDMPIISPVHNLSMTHPVSTLPTKKSQQWSVMPPDHELTNLAPQTEAPTFENPEMQSIAALTSKYSTSQYLSLNTESSPVLHLSTPNPMSATANKLIHSVPTSETGLTTTQQQQSVSSLHSNSTDLVSITSQVTALIMKSSPQSSTVPPDPILPAQNSELQSTDVPGPILTTTNSLLQSMSSPEPVWINTDLDQQTMETQNQVLASTNLALHYTTFQKPASLIQHTILNSVKSSDPVILSQLPSVDSTLTTKTSPQLSAIENTQLSVTSSLTSITLGSPEISVLATNSSPQLFVKSADISLTTTKSLLHSITDPDFPFRTKLSPQLSVTHSPNNKLTTVNTALPPVMSSGPISVKTTPLPVSITSPEYVFTAKIISQVSVTPSPDLALITTNEIPSSESSPYTMSTTENVSVLSRTSPDSSFITNMTPQPTAVSSPESLSTTLNSPMWSTTSPDSTLTTNHSQQISIIPYADFVLSTTNTPLSSESSSDTILPTIDPIMSSIPSSDIAFTSRVPTKWFITPTPSNQLTTTNRKLLSAQLSVSPSPNILSTITNTELQFTTSPYPVLTSSKPTLSSLPAQASVNMPGRVQNTADFSFFSSLPSNNDVNKTNLGESVMMNISKQRDIQVTMGTEFFTLAQQTIDDSKILTTNQSSGLAVSSFFKHKLLALEPTQRPSVIRSTLSVALYSMQESKTTDYAFSHTSIIDTNNGMVKSENTMAISKHHLLTSELSSSMSLLVTTLRKPTSILPKGEIVPEHITTHNRDRQPLPANKTTKVSSTNAVGTQKDNPSSSTPVSNVELPSDIRDVQFEPNSTSQAMQTNLSKEPVTVTTIYTNSVSIAKSHTTRAFLSTATEAQALHSSQTNGSSTPWLDLTFGNVSSRMPPSSFTKASTEKEDKGQSTEDGTPKTQTDSSETAVMSSSLGIEKTELLEPEASTNSEHSQILHLQIKMSLLPSGFLDNETIIQVVRHLKNIMEKQMKGESCSLKILNISN
ncbi:mucin-5AC-like [Polypterus senegalus]|uniref:mucin-5AC-like n=1 Tax=Polypterus senegalus TaxID=55291 RepID=UPI0019638811|nr:mucin-5AC-like [Polypterus senegalus]